MPYQSSKLLSFFALPLWQGKKASGAAAGLISEYFFHCIFLFLLTLCWLVSLPFFFCMVSLNPVPSLSLSFLGFHLHVPLPYLFVCLFCGLAQKGNFDSLRSPSCIESQNHPVLSFSYSSDLCKVKSSLLWKTFSFFLSLEPLSSVKPDLASQFSWWQGLS